MSSLDPKDIRLLARLQKNCQIPAQDLAEDLGMSASQISRRRQRLEAEGYILGTPCRLNPERLGLTVQAFIQVETRAQSNGTHQAIKRLVATTPEIVAAWTLTGEADYIFRVYCTDLAALNRLVQDVILPHESIGRVHSQIVMDQVKDDTTLPLPR
ncbi:Lrp/AsnC family transcriptional regulator [Marivita sp. XM-24bin2]|jgi:DNA-binding Lrp family transcriptional regulator|uniref:Lrp/AsnC family transcriptional regulator n=1 Tax=unclassified Marivita TaxID=2632480 RepID=UPI000D79162E|nr:Lrp/AsnC family transcriptional regulator [Marivita sp. XM-24bin2]MCR9107790.1 Lrp/AsnC family transcriptional regulator [Paracoccaceae bacterium]PWL35870.1 MAG: AsnC family transcriptional regulator [Marivita sp. XM-24bin2]